MLRERRTWPYCGPKKRREKIHLAERALNFGAPAQSLAMFDPHFLVEEVGGEDCMDEPCGGRAARAVHIRTEIRFSTLQKELGNILVSQAYMLVLLLWADSRVKFHLSHALGWIRSSSSCAVVAKILREILSIVVDTLQCMLSELGWNRSNA